jgi:hypothetical protein
MTSRLATIGAAGAGVAWIGVAHWSTRPGASLGVSVGCPIHAVTGLDCPGCGSTRALGALTRLDLWSALDQNVLVPLALLFVAAAWATWTWAVWHGRNRTDLVRGRWPVLAVGLVLAGFTVVRNFPAGSWLASGLDGLP